MRIPKVMGTEIEYGIYVGDNKEKYRYLEKNQIDFDESESSEKLFIAIKEIIRGCPSRFFLLSDSQRRFVGLRKDFHGNVLANGGRFYRDHLHPEFSTPECLSAKDLVIWEKAGERIVEESRKKASAFLDLPIIIYKDSCDRKKSSFGAHENYLLSPKTFEELIEVKGKVAQAWISFLVTRQIWAGAGKITKSDEEAGYQISQRADFIRRLDHADTMHERGIINTRDIPYADPKKFRRLHVIIGDANMSEYALWLKVGLSALLLEILEEDSIPEDLPILKNPVGQVRKISRDLTLKKSLELIDGRQMTAIQIQKWFSNWLSKWYFSSHVPNRGRSSSLEELLKEYCYVVDALESDPTKLADRLDYLIKLKLLKEYKAKHGLSWGHWRIRALDMAYHNIEKDKSVFYRLQEKGKVKRIVTDEEIEKALTEPPINTRAYFRSFCLRKFPKNIRDSSWDYIRFDIGKILSPKNFVIEYITPFRGTKEDCEALKFCNLKKFRRILGEKDYLQIRGKLV